MSKWLTPHLNNERQNAGSSRYLSAGLVAALFLAAIFLDGIIFPGFFGFRESFLTIIFLVVMLLYYEANLKGLILGVAFSGLADGRSILFSTGTTSTPRSSAV